MTNSCRLDDKVFETRKGFTLIEVLVCCFIIGLLIGMTLPAVQSVRESSRRMKCLSNLHMISLAMQNYLSESGCFPPIACDTNFGGRATGVSMHIHSPFVRILSQLEQTSLFNAVNFANIPDFPIGAVQNITVMKCTLDALLCPSDAPAPVIGFGRCNYRFSIGPTHTTASGSRTAESFLGPFTYHRVYSAASFQDGLSNTAGVSERLQGDWTNGVKKRGGDYSLTSPRALFIVDSATAIAICSSLPATAKIESRGGESWFLSGLHFTNFNHCITPNNSKANCAMDDSVGTLHDRAVLAGVFPATSNHSGGVNIALMDGSVRFMKDSVNPMVWRALGTRAVGDVTNSSDY